MSRQNSIERQLLDEVTSLKKMMVECEINGWLQTNRKQVPQLKNKIFFRPKMKPKSTRIMPVEQLQTIGDEIERDVSFKRLIFEKKADMNTCSTHCSKRVRRITFLENKTLESNEDNRIPSPEIKIKPFNTGYVLKELRKRVKQRSFLRKFDPETSNNPLAKSYCLGQLNTKDSIESFQNNMRRIEASSHRTPKASIRL